MILNSFCRMWPYHRRVLRTLFPDAVAVRWSTGDVPGELHPREQELIRSAVPSRVAEFRTGRTLARECLAEFMGPAAADAVIERHPDRSPAWPKGYCGSITHCTGLRIAVVARRGDVSALGVDAEPAVELPPEAVPELLTTEECRLLAERGVPDVLGFSAKESLYKLWTGMGGGWLGFFEARIANVDGRALKVEVTSNTRPCGVPPVIDIGYRISGGHVVTGAWL